MMLWERLAQATLWPRSSPAKALRLWGQSWTVLASSGTWTGGPCPSGSGQAVTGLWNLGAQALGHHRGHMRSLSPPCPWLAFPEVLSQPRWRAVCGYAEMPCPPWTRPRSYTNKLATPAGREQTYSGALAS